MVRELDGHSKALPTQVAELKSELAKSRPSEPENGGRAPKVEKTEVDPYKGKTFEEVLEMRLAAAK